MGLSPIVFIQWTHNFGTDKTDTLYIRIESKYKKLGSQLCNKKLVLKVAKKEKNTLKNTKHTLKTVKLYVNDQK